MTQDHRSTQPKENGLPATARGRRTRNAILHAAREVFEEDGFADARIADIMKRAKVSYGSFYNYFESKHEVFREVVSSAAGEIFLATHSDAPKDADPIERIRRSNRRYLDAFSRNARIMRVLEQVIPYDDYFNNVSLQLRKTFLDKTTLGIARLQAEGLADTSLNPSLAADMLGGMVENFAKMWFLMGEEHESEEAHETLTRLWAQALGLSMPPVSQEPTESA